MKKEPFVTNEQLQEIVKQFPTPFHLYDEKGIRENAQAVRDAFSWNPGFREYFAVKAEPNPFIIKILQEYGCGCDCSSLTELMLSDALGIRGEQIMFSSNETPPEEFRLADQLGAVINLDDITHIDFLEQTIGKIPETISCRYNPGGIYEVSNGIMIIIQRWQRRCLNWQWRLRKHWALPSALSTCPAVSASRTGRSSSQTISVPLGKAYAKYFMKYSFRQVLGIQPFIRRWDAL